MSSVVLRRIQARRAVLMERLEAVVAMQGIGEGASSGVEIDVLHDEMKFLHGLAFAMLAERELERAPVPHELTRQNNHRGSYL